jgi:Fur family zinc uptake transcriptional regulator
VTVSRHEGSARGASVRKATAADLRQTDARHIEGGRDGGASAPHAIHVSGPQDHLHDHGSGCGHAQERAAQAPQALAEAEALCRSRGLRLTPIRRDVLKALHATHRPLGAYDLADELARRNERRMAPITIYRALDFLLEQGLIHKLATQNAFVACPHRHASDEVVIFLICEICGGVDEVSSPELGAVMQRIRRKADFVPRAEVMEITGTCGHCKAA